MQGLLLAWLLALVSAAPPARAGPVIAGIDHIPLAVQDLPRAAQAFSQLGFSIKPGRAHGSGIRNQHIKFPDGSGLELITPGAGADALSAEYRAHLQQGDGPAFVSLHVRDSAVLASALRMAGIGFDQAAGLTTLRDPALGFVFIVADNRSPTDRPEHFAHANGAFAMAEVWIALADATPLRRLLAALGAAPRPQRVRVPPAAEPAAAAEQTEGEVFDLLNGRLVVVGGRHQRVPGRPVIGVVMAVRPMAGGGAAGASGGEWPRPLRAGAAASGGAIGGFVGGVAGGASGAGSSGAASGASSGAAGASDGQARLIGPDAAHGLWIKFRAAP